MEENSKKQINISKKRRIKLPKLSKIPKTVRIIILVIFLVIFSFIAGCKYGSSKEKSKIEKTKSTTKTSNSAVSNRWTAVGLITEISDTQIKVVDSRKKEYVAEINKDTSILDRKGTKLSKSDLKKDLKVIITGEKDKDKLKATRIRIQI